MNTLISSSSSGSSNSIESLRASILARNQQLVELEARIAEMMIINSLDCNIATITTAGFFQNLSGERFQLYIGPIVQCFLSEIKKVKSSPAIEQFKQLFDTESGLVESRMNDQQFGAFLKEFATQIALEDDVIKNKLMSRLLKLVTLEQIRGVVQSTFSITLSNKDIYTKVEVYQKNEKVFGEMPNSQDNLGVFLSLLSSLGKPVLNFFGNTLTTLDHLTAPVDNSQDSQRYFGTSMSTLTAVATAANGDPVLTSIGVSIPFVTGYVSSLISHFWNTPFDHSLLPLIVYSDKEFYDKIPPLTNRDAFLSQIAQSLQDGQIPVLVGEPGSGKTALLIEMARRIDEGTFGDFFKAKGYKVFGGSAADLLVAGGQWGGNKQMGVILNKIKEKRDHTILFLDEIQAFATEEAKTFLKGYFGSDLSIRHAVFATTTKGYDDFIRGDDNSLGRRFQPIQVPCLKSIEMEDVLTRDARLMIPNVILDHTALREIIGDATRDLARSKQHLWEVVRAACRMNGPKGLEEFDKKTGELHSLRLKLDRENLGRGFTSITHSGEFNGQKIEFEKIDISQGADSGFKALEVNRLDVMNALSELHEQQHIRDRLYEEVQKAFNTISVRHRYRFHKEEKQNLLDQSLKIAQDNNDGMPNFTIESIGDAIYHHSIEWLIAHGKEGDADLLRSAFTKREQAIQELNDYCKTREAYMIYCNAYLNRLSLGCESAIIFAEQKKLQLYIWEQSPTSSHLRLKKSTSSSTIDQYGAVHLLYSSDNHFDLLIPNLVKQIKRFEQELEILKDKCDSEQLAVDNYNRLLAGRRRNVYNIYDISDRLFVEFGIYLQSKGKDLKEIDRTKAITYFFSKTFQKPAIEKLVKKFIFCGTFMARHVFPSKIEEYRINHGYIAEINREFVVGVRASGLTSSRGRAEPSCSSAGRN